MKYSNLFAVLKKCGVLVIVALIINVILVTVKTAMNKWLLNNIDVLTITTVITILIAELLLDIIIQGLHYNKYAEFNALVSEITNKFTLLGINWRDKLTTGEIQKIYEYVHSITKTIEYAIVLMSKFVELGISAYLISTKGNFSNIIIIYIIATIIFESVFIIYGYNPISRKRIELSEKRDRLNSDLTLNLNLMGLYPDSAIYLRNRIAELNRAINLYCLYNIGVIVISIIVSYITYDIVLVYMLTKVSTVDKIKVFILLGSISEPLFWILNMLPEIVENSIKFSKVANMLSMQPDLKDGILELDILSNDYSIEFKNVSYSYDKKSEVLQDISFKINKGKRVAFVGSSGCGKSTLIKLLTRQIEPTSGEILIDGHNIKEYTLKSLRSIFGTISQDVEIMADSLRFNVAMAVLPRIATDEEIKSVCKGPLAKKIEELPEGLDTFVGDRGIKLSGGLKQLIALARILLSKREILVLDEATSALDNISERQVLKAIDKSMPGRTVIAVAHRLSTIRNYDVIHVIKDGHIVESGTYNELIDIQGTFAAMLDSNIEEITGME